MEVAAVGVHLPDRTTMVGISPRNEQDLVPGGRPASPERVEEHAGLVGVVGGNRTRSDLDGYGTIFAEIDEQMSTTLPSCRSSLASVR